MTRCSEMQRKLVYDYRNYILLDRKNSAYKSSIWVNLLSVFTFVFICFINVTLITNFSLDSKVIWMMIIMSLMIFMFIIRKVDKLFCKRYISNKLKGILSNNISINGATIISVDKNSGYFSYVEDNVKTYDGERYATDSNFNKRLTKNFNVGDRVIIIYGINSVFEDTYVMIAKDKTMGLINPKDEDLNIDYFINGEDGYINSVPNRSCAVINKYEYSLSDEEKQNIISSNFLKQSIASIKKLLTMLGTILGICINALVISFAVLSKASVGLIALIIVMTNVLLVAFMRSMYYTCEKRNENYPISDEVKEVVYISQTKNSKSENYIRVYEWNNNEIKCNEYPLLLFGTAEYGAILYKMKVNKAYYFYIKQNNLSK